MKERKRSADWYIAATHYLTAGFVVPLLAGLLYAFILLPLLVDVGSQLVALAASILLNILAIWFGVMYSARYLKNAYVIENPGKIVKLSTIYLVLLSGGYLAFRVSLAGMDIGYEILDLFVRAGVFYWASMRYVVATPANVFSQPA